MRDPLDTGAENTWCSGCGDFGILMAYKQAVKKLEEKGISRDSVIMTAGIGCFGKIFDYLNLGGIYGLHGRAHANAQGIKLANPGLKVITSVGDGDGYGEGISHMIFAAKRNADMTILVHNNEVYALTINQSTPTTKKGWKGSSTPRGHVEEPLNPLVLLLEAGATFVAKGFTVQIPHLADLIAQAVEHKGFSIVEIAQPCPSFHDTFLEYNEIVEKMETPSSDKEEARKQLKRTDKLPIGVLYKVEKPPWHELLLEGRDHSKNSMSKTDRRKAIADILKPRL